MRKALPFSLRVWRVMTGLVRPAATPLLMWRAGKGKEERGRLGERRGESMMLRPDGRLIWMHGASVGETVSLLPLIERLVQRGFSVLVTSGTVTSARVLESVAAAGPLCPWSGETRLFIRPPYTFRVIDGLVTNFHLPRSTLLLLVGAFAGGASLRAAYATAIASQYRFYSYGDAMLIV